MQPIKQLFTRRQNDVHLTDTNPTFGKPTIPHFNEVPIRPISGVGFVLLFFFLGGILIEVRRTEYNFPKSFKEFKLPYRIVGETKILIG